MTEISKVQIIPPSNAGSAKTASSRAASGEVRDLVVANAGDAGAFVRRSLFAHAGNTVSGTQPMVSAPFLAQHLDQELIRRDATADAHLAANSYARAASASTQRNDIALQA